MNREIIKSRLCKFKAGNIYGTSSDKEKASTTCAHVSRLLRHPLVYVVYRGAIFSQDGNHTPIRYDRSYISSIYIHLAFRGQIVLYVCIVTSSVICVVNVNFSCASICVVTNYHAFCSFN